MSDQSQLNLGSLPGIGGAMSFRRNFQRGKVTAATQVFFAEEKCWALLVWTGLSLKNRSLRAQSKLPLKFRVWRVRGSLH